MADARWSLPYATASKRATTARLAAPAVLLAAPSALLVAPSARLAAPAALSGAPAVLLVALPLLGSAALRDWCYPPSRSSPLPPCTSPLPPCTSPLPPRASPLPPSTSPLPPSTSLLSLTLLPCATGATRPLAPAPLTTAPRRFRPSYHAPRRSPSRSCRARLVPPARSWITRSARERRSRSLSLAVTLNRTPYRSPSLPSRSSHLHLLAYDDPSL
ncbi:hypothetical protein C8Q80DRAFT_1275657 [Daedaleopsis nitida]|nr:hypothetical protein C8Q80DRAFT_1275657 [Daedaleopsis nitida]